MPIVQKHLQYGTTNEKIIKNIQDTRYKIQDSLFQARSP